MRVLREASESARRSAFRIPRLALWAGVGIFVLTSTLLTSCGDDYEGGPRGNPNPNDPHPVWVFSATNWRKFDQNGHELLKVLQTNPTAEPKALNNETGDIWALDYWADVPAPSYIFDDEAKVKKKVGLVGGYPVYDTKSKVVWLVHKPESSEPYYLKKFDYDGRLLLNKPQPTEFRGGYGSVLYEENGDLWVTSNSNIHVYTALYKFNNEGELVFHKTREEFGLLEGGPYFIMFIDQVDGGLWLDEYKCFVKLNAQGKIVKRIRDKGTILDVSRKQGYLLTKEELKGQVVLKLYDRNGNIIWRYADEHSKYFGVVVDHDASCWYSWRSNSREYFISKIDFSGEKVIDGVVLGYYHEPRIMVKNLPYPHR